MACKTVQIVGQQVGALLAGNIMDANNPLRIADIPAGFVIGNTGNGNAFIPIPGLTFPELGELTDVDTSTAITGDVLHRTATGDWGPITLGPVAFSGDYNDLRSLPTLVTTFTGLSDTPTMLGGPNQLLAMDAAGADLTFIDLPQSSTTFVELTDTPPTLGGPDQFLAMNTAGTELMFVDLPQIPWDISKIGKNDLLIWDESQQLFVPTSINSVNHWRLKELDAVDTLFYDNRLVVIGDENAFSADRISEYRDVDLFINRRVLAGGATIGSTPRSVTPSGFINAAMDVNANAFISWYTLNLHSDGIGSQVHITNQDSNSGLDIDYYGTQAHAGVPPDFPKYVGAISWADTAPGREKTFAFHTLDQPVPATRLGAGWIRLDGRTTAQRPTSPITQEGMLMYNAETRSFEGYFSTDGTTGTLGWHNLYSSPQAAPQIKLNDLLNPNGNTILEAANQHSLILSQFSAFTVINPNAGLTVNGRVTLRSYATGGIKFELGPTTPQRYFFTLPDGPPSVGDVLTIDANPNGNNYTSAWQAPSAGSGNFLGLSDTPATYNAGYYVRVNGSGDALIFQQGIPYADLTGAPAVADNFLALNDTPGAWGTTGQIPAINASADGLEWVDVSSGLWTAASGFIYRDGEVVIGGTAQGSNTAPLTVAASNGFAIEVTNDSPSESFTTISMRYGPTDRLNINYRGTQATPSFNYAGNFAWTTTDADKENAFAFHNAGVATPATYLAPGYLRFDGRTAAQRPTSPITQEGMLMYNADTKGFEGYFSTDGTAGGLGWHPLYNPPAGVKLNEVADPDSNTFLGGGNFNLFLENFQTISISSAVAEILMDTKGVTFQWPGGDMYTFPATAPAAGDVLTAQDASTLVWQAPSGGGGGGDAKWKDGTSITAKPSITTLAEDTQVLIGVNNAAGGGSSSANLHVSASRGGIDPNVVAAAFEGQVFIDTDIARFSNSMITNRDRNITNDPGTVTESFVYGTAIASHDNDINNCYFFGKVDLRGSGSYERSIVIGSANLRQIRGGQIFICPDDAIEPSSWQQANIGSSTMRTMRLHAVGGLRIPIGTTAERANNQEREPGMIRFNNETNTFEGWDGSNWVTFSTT